MKESPDATLSNPSRRLRLAAIIAAITVACLLIALLALPATANAAQWHKHGKELKKGSSTIYYTQSSYFPANNDFGQACTFTVHLKHAGKKRVIFSTNASDLNLLAYYKDKLYYATGAAGSNAGSVYCYNTKTKKTKRVLKYGYHFVRSGSYLIGQMNGGVDYETDLYSINMKTAKGVTIVKNMKRYKIIGKKIYFVRANYSVARGTYVNTVWSCKLNGTGKKKLSGKFYGNVTKVVNKHTVKYYDRNTGKTKTFRF